MRIAYFLIKEPALIETFVASEISLLRKLGLEIRVYPFFRQERPTLALPGVPISPPAVSFSTQKNILTRIIHHAYFAAHLPVGYLKAMWSAFVADNPYVRFVFLKTCWLIDLLKKDRIEHIHANYASIPATMAFFVHKFTGIEYSFTAHAHDIFAYPLILQKVASAARFIVTVSQYNKRYLLARCPKLDSHKIKVIHCGVELPAEKNCQHVEDKFNILTVARLVAKKGIPYLIEACQILLREGRKNFLCQIVGDGELRMEIETQIREACLEANVRLLGALPHEQVLNLMQHAHIFVLPSIIAENGDREGIPVSLMEAMATGIPVISTTVSGIPELVKNGAGILVAPKNPGELSRALIKLMRASPDERFSMGKKGRQIVREEFNLFREGNKLFNLFQLLRKESPNGQLKENSDN